MTKGYNEWDITFQKDFKAVILENGDLYLSQIGDEFSDIFLIKKELVEPFYEWLESRLQILPVFKKKETDNIPNANS